VLFGVAGPSVAGIAVSGPRGRAQADLDARRTFAVVHEGLSDDGAWSVVVTLSDGSTRTVSR